MTIAFRVAAANTHNSTEIVLFAFIAFFFLVSNTGVARGRGRGGGLRGLAPQRMRKNIKASLVNLTLNMRYKMTNNIKFVITGYVFSSSKCTKMFFGRGPRWGSLRRSTRPASRLGSGIPLPIPLPLVAFSVSNSALSSQAPLNTKSWLRHCL